MSTLYYPFVPYGAVYVVQTTLPSGTIVYVDMAHLPRLSYFTATLIEVKGMDKPTAPSATPWGDAPFGGSVGVGAVVSSSNITVASFSEAVTSPHAANDLPFYVAWENTKGSLTKGGLRNFNFLALGNIPSPSFVTPAFGTPDTAYNYKAGAGWTLHDYGFGTDSFSLAVVGGVPTATWNMTGTTVPNGGANALVTGVTVGTFYSFAMSVVKLASTSVASTSLGAAGSNTQRNVQVMPITLTRTITAPSALILRGYAILPYLITTDLEKYPHGMSDTVFGSTNFMAGRAAESLAPTSPVTLGGAVFGVPHPFKARHP